MPRARSRKIIRVYVVSLFLALAQQAGFAQQTIPLQTSELTVGSYVFPVQLPKGFVVELLSSELRGPRILHFSGQRLFIGSKSGSVYWLDPPYTLPNELARLPDYPHSIVVKDNRIYVAQTGSVASAPYSLKTTSLSADQFEVVVNLPGGRGHNSRTLKVGPDGKLYVSLGITGNCSDEYLSESYSFTNRRGGVFTIEMDGDKSSLKPYASGLRNPVGFDWHPVTADLYTSNNGPDHMGYEQPREYFSRVEKGSFHGMPWYQYIDARIQADSCVSSDAPLSKESVTAPVASFPARIAPMDLTFVPTDTAFDEFEHDALVALHGSWATSNGRGDGNPASRREPKIVRVDFNNGIAGEVQDFMTGFQLPDGQRWARPIGIAVGPDGHVYFSSDAGIHGLYRIRYEP
jgi:glucose/arabinose dehydrogenase